jgi:hypothetical protein
LPFDESNFPEKYNPTDVKSFGQLLKESVEESTKTRTGYLKKDQQERYNSKRGWFVNAWRIVDENGIDMVQPWFDTKTQARTYARNMHIDLSE